MERVRRAAGIFGLLAASALGGEARLPEGVGPGPRGGEDVLPPAVLQPGLAAAPAKRHRPLTPMERRIEVLCRILAFRIVESFPSAHPSPLAGLAVRVLRPGAATDELAIAQERAQGLQAKGVHVPGYGIVVTLRAQVREGEAQGEAPAKEKNRPLWERIEEALASPEEPNGRSAANETSVPAVPGAPQDLAGRPTWKELIDLIVGVVAESSPRLEGLPPGESIIVIVHGVEGDIASAIPGLEGVGDAAAQVPQNLVIALRKADLDALAEGTLDRSTLLSRAVVVIPPPREIEVEPEKPAEGPEEPPAAAPGPGVPRGSPVPPPPSDQRA